ncbi:MAG: adenylate/guanylate cyclase domain-containing protein [candidate division WOR-3 bacterium]
MRFRGVYWIAIQDIGGFTTLSEQMAKKGKAGAEKLSAIIANFFREAETKILRSDGRIFKLAGDAYYCIFPASNDIQKLKSLGNELLNLTTLKKYGLRSRFISVRGEVECEWINLTGDYKDLLVKGTTIYDLSLLEEKTVAGHMFISGSGSHRFSALPIFSNVTHRIEHSPAHRPLYIAFVDIPQDFDLVHKVTDFFVGKKGNLNLLKWIPGKNAFKGLVIAGFPETTGREPEIFLNAFNELKEIFKNHEFRMGLSSGIVFAGDIKTKKFREFMILGDRVNVASRLCAAAPINNLYLSGEIQRMLKGKFDFVDVGEIKLKGREEKVRVYKPEKRIAVVFSSALFPYRFVGREKELNKALELINKKNGICLIGEAGIGKSRMLFEIKRRMNKRKIIALSLPPVAPPLFFIKEIFKHFPEGDFPELNKYFMGTVQLPTIRVIELLKVLFRTRENLIIFVEDLHWIDEASLFILRELVPLPFLMIASSRPEGDKIINGLGLHKMHLENLPLKSLKTLAEEITGAPPDKRLFNFLSSKSQGNPFYFEQILKDMQDRGLIIKKNHLLSIKEDARSLPFAIHSILLSKFEKLPRRVKEVVEFAACIGMEFETKTIEKLSPGANFLHNFDYTKGFLVKTDTVYQFKHSLFREAILDSLLDVKRRKYEKLIGEVFIKEDRNPYEIAHHLTEAGNAYQALPYWDKTFAELYDKGLHNEITNIIQRLGNYDDEHTQDVSTFLNALYLIKMGDYYDAEQILAKLKKKQKIRKEVLLALAGLYDWSSQHNKMALVLKKLKCLLMTTSERLTYLELWGIYYDMMGHNRKALDYYKRSLRIAQRNNLRTQLLVSLFNIGWIYFKRRKYAKAEVYFRQSLNYVEEGDLFCEGTTLLRLGQIEMLKENTELALNYLNKSLKDFQILNFVYWERLALDALVNLYIILGKKKRARWFAQRHDEVARMGNFSYRCMIQFNLYYGNLNGVEKEIKGKEKELPHEYFLYLLARNKKEEAIEFLKKYNLLHILPSKRNLKQKTFPLNFLTLYKKYMA